MRLGIHPDYRPVVFLDRSAGTAFPTRSTATTDRTAQWEDGATHPVVDVEVSAASHPSWTGRSRVLDGEGRVERFRRRYSQQGSQHGSQQGSQRRAPAGGAR